MEAPPNTWVGVRVDVLLTLVESSQQEIAFTFRPSVRPSVSSGIFLIPTYLTYAARYRAPAERMMDPSKAFASCDIFREKKSDSV